MGAQEKTNNGKYGRKPWKMMARRVQNGGEMAPKLLPGDLWAGLGRGGWFSVDFGATLVLILGEKTVQI